MDDLVAAVLELAHVMGVLGEGIEVIDEIVETLGAIDEVRTRRLE
jgi:hypothetical protein